MLKKYLLFLVAAMPLLMSYMEPYPEPQTAYYPIVMTREQLSSSIRFTSEHKLENPGKIYMKGGFIYIVEKFEGVHIINNYDRSKPEKLGFINIPGCVDVAIKGNHMYADNAVDLITIDLSAMPNIKVTSRETNVFPELVAPDLDYVPYFYSYQNRPENTVIVAWILKD